MNEANASRVEETLRRLAEFEASAAVETRSKLIDEHNSAFRWMIASLFALNGGAIFSMLSSDALGLSPTFAAFWVFFGGIVSTFLSVFFAQISDRNMIVQMHKWGLYWSIVAATSERNEDTENKIKKAISKAERLGRLARLQAVFAMIFFVLGVLSVAVLEQKAAVASLEAELSRIEGQQMRETNDR